MAGGNSRNLMVLIKTPHGYLRTGNIRVTYDYTDHRIIRVRTRRVTYGQHTDTYGNIRIHMSNIRIDRMKNDPRSCERNLCMAICVRRLGSLKKFRTSTESLKP